MQFLFHCIRFLLLPYTYVLLHYLDSQIVPQGYSSIVAFEYFSGILFFEEHILFCTIFQLFCYRTDGNYYLKLSCQELITYPYTLFPHIVSPLEQFPPLNSFCTLMQCVQRSQYIRPNSKKNSFRRNYLWKCGIQIQRVLL